MYVVYQYDRGSEIASCEATFSPVTHANTAKVSLKMDSYLPTKCFVRSAINWL